MMCFFLLLIVQEYYYVDGTEFELTDRTVIKTLAPITEDLYNYSFHEGNELIVIPRHSVKSVDYFSFRLLGRRPPKAYKNVHQRRIKGSDITFEREGKTHLRFRVTDQFGKNMEGRVFQNIVKFIWLEQAGDTTTFGVTMENCKPETITQVTFYSFKGKPIHRSTIQVPAGTKGAFTSQFAVAKPIDVRQVGLVEVATVAVDGNPH